MGVERTLVPADMAVSQPAVSENSGAPDGIGVGEIDAVNDGKTPAHRWPAGLRNAYDAEIAARVEREQHFLHLLGLLTCLATIPIDYMINPAMVEQGILLRALGVAPITLIGLIAGASGWRMLSTISIGLGPIAFVGVIVMLTFSLPPNFAAIYLTATTLVLALANLVLPFGMRGKIIFTSACIAVVLAVIWAKAGTFASHDSFLLLLGVVACVIIPLAYRFERLEQRNFLLNARNRIATNDLREANRQLRFLSERDPLTGILNRRGFEDVFDRQVFGRSGEAETAGERRFVVLMIDIDHFKHFNDTHGHQAGDTCLSMVANALESVFAEVGGCVGRFGGEEFIGAFVETSAGQSGTLAEDIRAIIAAMLVPTRTDSHAGGRSLVTASIGVGRGPAIGADSAHREAAEIRETLTEMADAALYSAKRAGRDRVRIVTAGDSE